jgi:hypothetical protein
VWAPSGREIFYLALDNKLMTVSVKLGAESVEPSAPRELFTVPLRGTPVFSPYDVAPDGQRFLLPVPAETGSPPLHVIPNWPALLKKGTGVE